MKKWIWSALSAAIVVASLVYAGAKKNEALEQRKLAEISRAHVIKLAQEAVYLQERAQQAVAEARTAQADAEEIAFELEKCKSSR